MRAHSSLTRQIPSILDADSTLSPCRATREGLSVLTSCPAPKLHARLGLVSRLTHIASRLESRQLSCQDYGTVPCVHTLSALRPVMIMKSLNKEASTSVPCRSGRPEPGPLEARRLGLQADISLHRQDFSISKCIRPVWRAVLSYSTTA